jgi:hypothetical protein
MYLSYSVCPLGRQAHSLSQLLLGCQNFLLAEVPLQQVHLSFSSLPKDQKWLTDRSRLSIIFTGVVSSSVMFTDVQFTLLKQPCGLSITENCHRLKAHQ